MADSLPFDGVLQSITDSFVRVSDRLARAQATPVVPGEPQPRFEVADVEIRLSYVVVGAKARPPTSIDISGPVPFTSRQIGAIQAGAGEVATSFDVALAGYRDAKSLLRRMASGEQIEAVESRIVRVEFTEADIERLRAGAPKDAVRRLRQFLDDYAPTLATLDRTMSPAATTGEALSLQVRVDPEALAEAPEGARQELSFRLAPRSNQTVLVDGQPITPL